MKVVYESVIYESPQVEIIEVEVEKGFAVSNVENPKEDVPGSW